MSFSSIAKIFMCNNNIVARPKSIINGTPMHMHHKLRFLLLYLSKLNWLFYINGLAQYNSPYLSWQVIWIKPFKTEKRKWTPTTASSSSFKRLLYSFIHIRDFAYPTKIKLKYLIKTPFHHFIALFSENSGILGFLYHFDQKVNK